MAKRKRVRTPTSGWHEVAAGDVGDKMWWKDGYESLSSGEAMIGLLWQLDDWGAIDWDYLLKGLPRFNFLRTLGPDEAFEERAWGEVDGFIVDEPAEEEMTGSMSGEWTYIRIEMDHSQKKTIFHDFDELSRRLEAYPPLQPFI